MSWFWHYYSTSLCSLFLSLVLDKSSRSTSYNQWFYHTILGFYKYTCTSQKVNLSIISLKPTGHWNIFGSRFLRGMNGTKTAPQYNTCTAGKLQNLHAKIDQCLFLVDQGLLVFLTMPIYLRTVKENKIISGQTVIHVCTEYTSRSLWTSDLLCCYTFTALVLYRR